MTRPLSPMGRAALFYACELGWPVFPLGACSKAPLVPEDAGGHGFKDASAHPEQIAEWWDREPRANIGCAPGMTGHLVIDIDGPEGEATAQRLGLQSVHTMTALSARGRHLWFPHPGGFVSNEKIPPKIDIRCDAGYVLLPPAVHPTGAVYAWMNGGPPDETLADIPPAALEAIRTAQLLREEAEAAAQRVPSPFPVSCDSAQRIRRARAWLAAVPATPEGGRNSKAFPVAAQLLRDFDLGDGDAWALLVEWNLGNLPPLGEKELRGVFKSARRNAKHARGRALARDAKAGAEWGHRKPFANSRFGRAR